MGMRSVTVVHRLRGSGVYGKAGSQKQDEVKSRSWRVRQALETGEGVLRLAPTWVPRSFLTPGRRIKLNPKDIYAYGAHRGGIDERWFASTTPCRQREPPTRMRGSATSSSTANAPSRSRDAVPRSRARLIGAAIWRAIPDNGPSTRKFFDNMGPIPHHMHQNDKQAALVGQEGKPESYYFPPQLNTIGNNFPYTFFGLEPGTDQGQISAAAWTAGTRGTTAS